MICGTYPPESCGIGDYLFNIVKELQNKYNEDLDIQFIVNQDWSTRRLFSFIKEVKRIKPDIIHIQYPSQGYGLSFIPHLLSVYFKNTIVTIHEVSHVKLLRRLSLFFFSLRSNIIFTNDFEYKNFKKLFPWFNKQKNVIPIGSNIIVKENLEYRTSSKNQDNNAEEVIYFGQIRPKKGIEDFIEAANLYWKKGDNSSLKFVIMGQVLPAFKEYFGNLQNEIIDIVNIELRINLNEIEIFRNLRNASIAYLPFPDGISERRGSFFAALASNTPVFSTSGSQTTNEIRNLVNIVETPLEFIDKITKEGIQTYQSKIDKVNAVNFLKSHSWENIAAKHFSLYKKLKNR